MNDRISSENNEDVLESSYDLGQPGFSKREVQFRGKQGVLSFKDKLHIFRMLPRQQNEKHKLVQIHDIKGNK